MINLIKVLYVLLFALISAQNAPIDGILAVVEENIILHSDVVQQSQMIAMQQGINPSNNPYMFEKIYNQTLLDLVDQYILLAAAEKDTTIIISNDEVDYALEQQFNEIVARAGSEAALEQALGKSVRNIKKDYWIEIKNMMLIDRFKYTLFSETEVSRKEVEIFYESYKDSLPATPENYDFSLIELPISISAESKLNQLREIEVLRNKIIDGFLSFEDVAKESSEDPGSSSLGGDLGYMKRGTLVPEYEEVAFSLEINEISKPVLTDFGYHIIQLLDRKGEKIHTRHILRFLKASKKDKETILNKIRNIYNSSVNDPGLFDSLSQAYSIEYKNNSGLYKNFEITATLNEEIINTIRSTDINTLSYPFEINNDSICLVYVYNKNEPSKPTLENSWDNISSFAKNNKMNTVFQKWLDKNKKQTYIKFFQ